MLGVDEHQPPDGRAGSVSRNAGSPGVVRGWFREPDDGSQTIAHVSEETNHGHEESPQEARRRRPKAAKRRRPRRPRRPSPKASQAEEAQRPGRRRPGAGRIEGADERQGDDRGDGREGPVDQPRRQDAARHALFARSCARSTPRAKRPGSRRPIAATSPPTGRPRPGFRPNAPRSPTSGRFLVGGVRGQGGPPAATRAKLGVHGATLPKSTSQIRPRWPSNSRPFAVPRMISRATVSVRWTDCVLRGRGGGGKPSVMRQEVPKRPPGAARRSRYSRTAWHPSCRPRSVRIEWTGSAGIRGVPQIVAGSRMCPTRPASLTALRAVPAATVAR